MHNYYINPYSVRDFIGTLGPPPKVAELPRPELSHNPSPRNTMFALRELERHMTDEGWQLQLGLRHSGVSLWGKDMDNEGVDVDEILARTDPGLVIMQDQREWDGSSRNRRWRPDLDAAFRNYECLAGHASKHVTILKDTHARPEYHRQAAEAIGCHNWIVYYHPRIVKHTAPYVRLDDLVRTYHSIDWTHLPKFLMSGRRTCLLSGAISHHYPLRKKLLRMSPAVTDYLRHPGYGASGTATNSYLATLVKYKVAICTASRYGYALRKIIEATACGCIVLTDLPTDEVLPYIDDNLVRISPRTSVGEVEKLVTELARIWDSSRQLEFALKAAYHYDYRTLGKKLVADLRKNMT